MDHARRLAFHGMVLFLLGLLMGTVVQSVANPRMGLSAHTGTVLNGVLLVALAAVWRWERLTEGTKSVTYWLAVVGSYVSCIALFFAGVFGTSGSTPLNGAGHAGTPLQETLVGAGLTLGGIAVLIAAVFAVYGLRGRAEDDSSA